MDLNELLDVQSRVANKIAITATSSAEQSFGPLKPPAPRTNHETTLQNQKLSYHRMP